MMAAMLCVIKCGGSHFGLSIVCRQPFCVRYSVRTFILCLVQCADSRGVLSKFQVLGIIVFLVTEKVQM